MANWAFPLGALVWENLNHTHAASSYLWEWPLMGMFKYVVLWVFKRGFEKVFEFFCPLREL